MGAIPAIIGAVVGIAGIAQSAKSQKASEEAFDYQKEAQKIQWQEEIDTHKFNIKRSGEEARGLIGDFQREGAAFSRGQMAAMGAAGAEVGSGTPLMNMLQTQAGTARDVLRVQRASDLEIEFAKEQIGVLEGNIEGLGEEEVDPLNPYGVVPDKRFPSDPEVGDQYMLQNKRYEWNGSAWIKVEKKSSGGKKDVSN